MFFYACSSSKECRLSTRKLCDKRCQHNILCSQFIIFLHWITAEYYVLCWFIFAFSKWKASSVPFAYPALQNREACRMPSIFTHAKIAPLILFLSFFCYFFFLYSMSCNFIISCKSTIDGKKAICAATVSTLTFIYPLLSLLECKDLQYKSCSTCTHRNSKLILPFCIINWEPKAKNKRSFSTSKGTAIPWRFLTAAGRAVAR